MEIWASNAEDMCLVSLNRGTCFYMSKFAHVWSRNCTRANSVVRSAVYAKVSVVPAAGCSGVSEASFDFRGCCASTTTLPSCHSSLAFCRQPVSGPHWNKCYWHLLAFFSCRQALETTWSMSVQRLSLFLTFSCLPCIRIRLSALRAFWKMGSCNVSISPPLLRPPPQQESKGNLSLYFLQASLFPGFILLMRHP